MAYQSQNLSALAYSNGFTLWHYRTADPASDVDNAGYFNVAAAMLRTGDFVLINAGLGTAPTHGVMVVAANSGVVVDVANLSAFAALNTD